MDELRRLNATADSMDEPLGFAERTRAPRVRRVKPTMGPRLRLVDLVLAVILTLAQVALGGLFVFGAVLLGFSYDACSDPVLACDYSLAPVAFYIVPVAVLVALIGTIVTAAMRRRRGRTSWWVPPAFLGLSLAAFGVSVLLTMIATRQPIP